MINVGINGFGRIGRLILRASLERTEDDIRIVAINDIGNIDQNLHLLKFDSVHGKLGSNAKVKNNKMFINDNPISFYSKKHPEDIPWSENNVDIVLECTGLFTDKEKRWGTLKIRQRKY